MHDPDGGWATWLVGKSTDAASSLMHIVPEDDLGPHHPRTTCPCKPKREHVMGGGDESNKVVGFMIIHNAWDGRE